MTETGLVIIFRTFGDTDTARIEALDNPEAIAELQQRLRQFWSKQQVVFRSGSDPISYQSGDKKAPRANP